MSACMASAAVSALELGLRLDVGLVGGVSKLLLTIIDAQVLLSAAILDAGSLALTSDARVDVSDASGFVTE